MNNLNTVVLKFGGSSVADNKKLNIVAEKIINYKKQGNNVIVVVSAQGKTTNRLINESLELSRIPDDREMDTLLSSGEQVSASKLSILLNKKGYPSISLMGWQAGIRTNDIHGKAKIECIYTGRIERELNFGKIIVVAGFQGIDDNGDITTLGRGGSDTTAVAIASAIRADKCYIFSDVDGIYSADPRVVEGAKKLENISYEEMGEISDAGSKVLHNRCIKIGQEFNTDIIAAGTFEDSEGTRVVKDIEKSMVKSIVKNTNMIRYILKKPGYFDRKETYEIYMEIISNNISLFHFRSNDDIEFYITKDNRNKLEKILETKFGQYKYEDSKKVMLSIIGYGITNDNKCLLKITDLLELEKVEVISIDMNQTKIELILNDLDDSVVKKLHDILI